MCRKPSSILLPGVTIASPALHETYITYLLTKLADQNLPQEEKKSLEDQLLCTHASLTRLE